MKKITSLALLIVFALTCAAQATQPDAEYLLIRRSYKVNSDKTIDIRYRKEIKLIRNRAITAYADKGETFITYNPAFEELKINECYTVRADGTRVQTPKNAFVLQLPSECADCGRLNGIREMAIVHTALEYNCTIVLDYTIHRKSPMLSVAFDLQQDCPVKRYEIRYPDGHTETHTDLPQKHIDPYMPVKRDRDVVFMIGDKPSFKAETALPEAATLLSSLKREGDLQTLESIRDWVVDYVRLNPVDPARTDYAMTPAGDVFRSNCGTFIDKTGLLAALLNQAGFSTVIKDNSLNAFGDRPLEIETTVGDKKYVLSATSKGAIRPSEEAAQLPQSVYIDKSIEWKPDTITENYVRIALPEEKEGLHINPAFLQPSRESEVQVKTESEFYHYTIELPKEAKLLGGDVNIDYTLPSVGSINVIIKQSGRKLLITRSLRLRKAVITPAEYAEFRQIMMDWNSHKELFFSI